MSNALPELSDKFAPAIEEAARGCKVLYIVAQPQLSRIPFAALSFRDGSPLVSRCAVASAPSATSLKLLLSRPKALGARTCLAIGVGSEAHYRFEDQAKAIRALGGWEACDVLEPASSKEAWLKAAPTTQRCFWRATAPSTPAHSTDWPLRGWRFGMANVLPPEMFSSN